MANLEILRNDLRVYAKNARSYTGSATDAVSRQNALLAVLGDLPWGMKSDFKFRFRMSLELGSKSDIEKFVEKHVALVVREIEMMPKAPKFM